MAIEIERKFLVNSDEIIRVLCFMPHVSYDICQYYITENIRLRMETHSDGSSRAYYTIKTIKDGNLLSREETHKEVDYETIRSFHHSLYDSKEGIGVIRKTRHVFNHDENTKWEVDFYHSDNEELIIAEIEIPSEDYDLKISGNNCFSHRWIGEEVTGVEKYYNFNLAKNPYIKWRYDK